MIEYIVLILVLITFIIASIEDIKKREVYDYINYALSFLILAITIFHSILIESFDPIKYVGFGLLVGFALGSILYYIGVWGGGDAKFLIGFAASTFYLLKFAGTSNMVQDVYLLIEGALSYVFNLFIATFLDYLIFLDILFLSIILLKVLFTRRRDEFENLFTLFLIIFLLFIGLYFNYSNFILIVLGFFSFLLIFFGPEDSFSSVYFKIKKKIHNLSQGDRIDDTIMQANKVVVAFEEGKDGLNKEHILKIKENINDNKLVSIRKVLPYSILVTLNYAMYIINIISLDNTNLDIIGFLFKFLFFSFFAGSIIAVAMLTGYYIINFKKVKINFLKIEKIILSIFSIFTIIFSIIFRQYLAFSFIFASIIFIYLFLKVARGVELKMFVKKKEVTKIALGDWIAQDIKVNGKIIYSQNDFKLGIDEKQYDRIKKLYKTHKELRYIYVKDGLAFLPALLIGFIVLLLL